METLYLVEPGVSLKLEVIPEVKEMYLKEDTEGLTMVQRMDVINRIAGGIKSKREKSKK